MDFANHIPTPPVPPTMTGRSAAPAGKSAVIVFSRSAAQDALRWGWGTEGVSSRKLLLENVLRTVSRLGRRDDVDVHLFHSGELDADITDLTKIHLQRGTDFGARLNDAVARMTAAGYERVVVVGSDVPHLRASHVRDALDLLASHRLVLGPDAAGGCYLIGIQASARSLLQGITWQQGTDLAQLQAKLPSESVRLLPETLRDLDAPEDIRELSPKGLSVTLRLGLARLLIDLSDNVLTDWKGAAEITPPPDLATMSPHLGRGPPASCLAA